MKKYLFVFALSSFITSTCVKAQSEKPASDKEYKVVICANSGSSLIGSVFKAVDNGVKEVGVPEFIYKYRQTPALQISGDYYPSKFFSIGAAICYQKFTGEFNNYSFKRDSLVITTDFDVTITRTQIGARALFHFYNKKRLDVFSGLRIGPTIWKASASASDPDLNVLNIIKINSIKGSKSISASGAAIGVQFLYLGMRGYITDNIGLNFELAIGSPYYASAGLNCRF